MDATTDLQVALLAAATADILITVNSQFDDQRRQRLALAALLYDFGNCWAYMLSDGRLGTDPTSFIRGG
jgi:hypothetical protein